MKKIPFVTTNRDKFANAQQHLAVHGIEIIQEVLEMNEPQTSDGREIVRQKADQAYSHLKQPILVNDDTWSIPALRGFPSTGMKLCNDFLKAADWLRLMKGIEDRRIILTAHFAFFDGETVVLSQYDHHLILLNEAKGTHLKSPILEIVSRNDSELSIAQEIASGRQVEATHEKFWQELAQVMQNSEKN